MVFKGEKVTLWYAGRATGLTDVILNLWNPDRTQIVTDGAVTELGNKLYYYEFTATNTVGDWIGYIDSATEPGRRTVSFRVETRTTAGGVRYGYAESLWDKKLLDKLWKELSQIKSTLKKPHLDQNDLIPVVLKIDEQHSVQLKEAEKLVQAYDSLKAEIANSSKPDPRIQIILDSHKEHEDKLDRLASIFCEALEPEALERLQTRLQNDRLAR